MTCNALKHLFPPIDSVMRAKTLYGREASLGQLGTQCVVVSEGAYGSRKSLNVTRRHQDAGYVGRDDLAWPEIAVETDYWKACRHRFH